MGGYGSGRPGWKGKVEHCRSIDANRLNKAGHFRPGHGGGWQWTNDGKQVASIGTRAEAGRLILNYRMRPKSDGWEDIEEPILVTWTACNQGGSRPYFLCPCSVNGRMCGWRVIKLYLGSRYFVCRHCMRLAYASQSEDRHDRILRRVNCKKQALGMFETGFPRKPKGMWAKTFERHMETIYELEDQADAAFGCWIARRYPGQTLANLMREITGK